jgi:hypothetical protein
MPFALLAFGLAALAASPPPNEASASQFMGEVTLRRGESLMEGSGRLELSLAKDARGAFGRLNAHFSSPQAQYDITLAEGNDEEPLTVQLTDRPTSSEGAVSFKGTGLLLKNGRFVENSAELQGTLLAPKDRVPLAGNFPQQGQFRLRLAGHEFLFKNVRFTLTHRNVVELPPGVDLPPPSTPSAEVANPAASTPPAPPVGYPVAVPGPGQPPNTPPPASGAAPAVPMVPTPQPLNSGPADPLPSTPAPLNSQPGQ